MEVASSVSIKVLGTGAGATKVFHNECSSSFVLLLDDKPVLLADIGYGVVSACQQYVGKIPPAVYVSHNHSDHAGELPITLSVEAAAGRKLHVIAHEQVMSRLLEHRLAELNSTGQPLDHFARFDPATEAGHTLVTPDGSITLKCVRSQHSECCYGAVLYWRGQALLGWTADSGCDAGMYAQLAQAPCLLIDARAKGSYEHASFEQAGQIAKDLCHRGKTVFITGYGCQNEAPGVNTSDSQLCGAQPVKPGQHITLWRKQESEAPQVSAEVAFSMA